ncbi:MAG TPA: beta-aryl ether-cleaving protein [Rhodospirillaceae bacterium]|nr:beta-aryl ether-cleaving protein [Rhodospirillaceae bacterium]
MAITLYDLVGRDDRRFSSNCCKTVYALAHKGLAFKIVPTRFIDIAEIRGGELKTVPVIRDGDRWVGDSWNIAVYLEKTYPDEASVFGGVGGIEHARFVAQWNASEIQPLVMTMIVNDIYQRLDPADQPYFWESRKKRLGRPINEVVIGREERLPTFRARLEPLRRVISDQPFLGGADPVYSDYLAMAPFIWGRRMSPFTLLESDDPVYAWVHRCLDLYGGLMRHKTDFDW